MTPERHSVETTYRGKRYRGEWYVADGQVHVVCPQGAKNAPVFGTGSEWLPSFPLPSETAEALLWKVLREADPEPPFFSWR
jgi:hypothetical protein